MIDILLDLRTVSEKRNNMSICCIDFESVGFPCIRIRDSQEGKVGSSAVVLDVTMSRSLPVHQKDGRNSHLNGWNEEKCFLLSQIDMPAVAN